MASDLDKEHFACTKCKRTKLGTNFYTLKDGGKSDMCKQCETMHINNWEPETYLWLLKRYDVPYLPWEWDVLRDRAAAKDPKKLNGMSVFGKYLAKMKLKQFKDNNFEDSERLQLEREEKLRAMGLPEEQIQQKIEDMKEAFENGEITEAQYKTYVGITQAAPDYSQNINEGSQAGGFFPQADIAKVDLPDIGSDLTEEDKIYLATKWGRLYSAAEWVTLEKMYTEYDTSFSLHNADLIRGTIQLCKLDLKGNQALDSGDIDAYSKIARASDALRKSLKFTEAQRKDEKSAEFSCYGAIVAFAELNNDEDYIRPISLDVDRDVVDRDIRNMKDYTKQLIDDDPTIFKMIEQYIKKREALDQQERDKIEADDGVIELTDDDFKEFREMEEALRQLDEGWEDEDD